MLLEPIDPPTETTKRLKDAVYKSFLSQVYGAMGSGGTIGEVIKEYGDTGPFAGIKIDRETLIQALEDEFPFNNH